MNNFILTAEGGRFMDRGVWSTHKVMGAYPSIEAATAAIPDDFTDEEICVVTDLNTMKPCRVFGKGQE